MSPQQELCDALQSKGYQAEVDGDKVVVTDDDSDINFEFCDYCDGVWNCKYTRLTCGRHTMNNYTIDYVLTTSYLQVKSSECVEVVQALWGI